VILLDTNIVSEVMAPAPGRLVLDWLNSRASGTVYLPAITVAEIRYGLEILPRGRRRRDLEERFARFVARGFSHRVLPFDEAAAEEYGPIMAERRRLGRPMSILDGQIAAIAKSRHFALATRNVRDFEECGLELVNPFELEV
jgi:predicted nucleic acid-binding protein